MLIEYLWKTWIFMLIFTKESNGHLSTEFRHYVNQDVHKFWFHYISKYLEENILNSFASLLRLTKIWAQLIKQPMRYTSVVTQPLGHLSTFVNDNETLQYNLDYRLRLNLTFHYIHIAYNGLYECFLGSLTVKSFQKSFQYCGVQSGIVNYPHGNHSIIVLRIAEKGTLILFKILMSFSVISNNNYENLPAKYTPIGIPLWVVYLKGKYSILVLRFVISVHKYERVLLYSSLLSPHFIVVYDGPGNLSPKTVISSSLVFEVKSFQCTIDAWIHSDKNYPQQLQNLTYSTQQKEIYKSFQINSQQLLSLKVKNPTIVSISTEVNLHINATIKNFNYNGLNDPLCTFGGLAIYNIFSKSKSEISTECISSKDNYQHPPIYSKHNSILLVIYFYPEYGNINLSLSISATPCHPVIINTCTFAYLCRSSRTNPFCKQLVNNLKQLPTVEANYQKGEYLESIYQQTSYLRFAVPNGECHVLQMTQHLHGLPITKSFFRQFRSFENCKIGQLKHISLVESQRLVQYFVAGYLNG